MEPKASPSLQADAPAEAPRRRGSAGKRKASSSFGPSKRHAKERNPFHMPPTQLLHNGPLTRAARQSPHKLAGAPETASPAAAAAAAAAGGVGGGGGKQAAGDVIRLDEEEPVAQEEPPLVDKEFEAVRSRGAGVHVVPTFAGWFSWKEIHPIEKQMLSSFFSGKSEKRTPEMYLVIRNFIMRKFHADPQVQLESKDLAELSTGEMDARQEVLEFLDHWGLVNFHPFPSAQQDGSKPEESKSNADTEEKASLVEKLFKFEPVQSYLVPVPNKSDAEAPAPVPSLLPESALADDLVTAAEPSVEYHCNSCSVDCSRNRYHCRTQADFDLCSDCYNEGKFDPGMAKTDFILMESAEVPGASGTSWTDQETLLLLEGLELFGANWSEIAEHVATKTKAQCMLHFLQMPIEDSYLDGEDVNQTIQETTEQVSTEKDTAETPEKMEVEEKEEGKETADWKASEKTEGNRAETKTGTEDNNSVENKDTKNSGDIDPVTSSNTDESKKSSDADPTEKENSADVDTSSDNVSNVAIDVLKSAFEAVGHFPEQEGSFADAGNPVMALAAFLAGLVEHDNAITSCRSSLKAISEVSPALQLAMRHSFILEDPPNDLKDPLVSVSSAITGGEDQKDEDKTPNSNNSEKKDSNEKEQNALSVENQNNPSTSQESLHRKASCDGGLSVESKSNDAKDSVNPIAPVDNSASDNTKDACNSTSHSVIPPNDTNEHSSLASQEAAAGSTEDASDPELLKEDKASSEKPVGDSSSQGKVELNRPEDAIATLTTIQEHKSDQTLENGKLAESNSKKNIIDDDEKGSKVTAKHEDSISRLKRAAATTISAAAVKAKLLAEQEEDQIRQLAALMIEKQFQKMEAKMSLFADVENLVLRVREYTEKTRKKLLMERNAIIAARLGTLPSRPNQSAVPGNRLPVGYGIPGPRPPMAMPRNSS